MKPAIKRALFDSLPIFAAFIPLGMVWGILWEQEGLSIIWALFFSLTLYAGAVQFLALSFIAAGGSLLAMTFAILPVALRNSFYVIALLKQLPSNSLAKAYTAFTTTDAPFAILLNQNSEKDPYYTVPLFMSAHVYWILGTGLGVWIGKYIPNQFESLDFALPALIGVLAMEQLKKQKNIYPLILALGSAALMRIFFGEGYLPPAIIFCAVACLFLPKREAA